MLVPPGSYKMGIADRADDTRDAEEVDVTISNGFGSVNMNSPIVTITTSDDMM